MMKMSKIPLAITSRSQAKKRRSKIGQNWPTSLVELTLAKFRLSMYNQLTRGGFV
jgi:hypothetical protein